MCKRAEPLEKANLGYIPARAWWLDLSSNTSSLDVRDGVARVDQLLRCYKGLIQTGSQLRISCVMRKRTRRTRPKHGRQHTNAVHTAGVWPKQQRRGGDRKAQPRTRLMNLCEGQFPTQNSVTCVRSSTARPPSQTSGGLGLEWLVLMTQAAFYD